MSRTIRIERDNDAESPREHENLWRIAGWHGRYHIGDEQPKIRPGEHLAKLPKDTLVVPLYMYDHGGITIATTEFSCQFDSGQVGHCWVTPEQIKAEYGEDTPETRAKAREVLEGEVKVYDMYLKGDCWQFSIKGADGNYVGGCAGYFGDDPIENGMIDNIEYGDMDAFVDAAREAGMTVNEDKLREYKARASQTQMRSDTPVSSSPAKSAPRV